MSRLLLQRFLTDLALWLHQRKGRTFSMDDLIAFLLDVQRKSWGDTTDLVHRIISSGVIEVVARDTYSFRHQTFQEYLAAVELARRLTTPDPTQHQEAWDLAWSKRTYSRWTEVLRLMVGVLAQTSGTEGHTIVRRWVRALLAEQQDANGDPGNLGLALALKSLTEVSEMEEWASLDLTEIEQEIIVTWIKGLIISAQYYNTSRVKRLNALAYDIGLLREPTIALVLRFLTNALSNRSKNVRKEVVNALRTWGERLPLHILLVPLQDKSSEVRGAAQEILYEQSSNLLHEPILTELLKHTSSDVRYAAVIALLEQGERVPIEVLINALRDEASNVRAVAVEALGEQGERVAVKVVMEAMREEESCVRSRAMEALGKQGERVAVEVLIKALQDEDSYVRGAAVEALGKQRERVSVELVLPAIGDDDRSVQDAVISLFAAPHFRDMLTEVTTEARAILQGEAPGRFFGSITQGFLAEVIEDMGYISPLFVEQLLPMLDWHYWQVRIKAIRALGKIRRNIPDIAIHRLLELRHDSVPAVRGAADDALAEILSLEAGMEDEV